MKVTLVLYCSENAEFACKEIEHPPVLQERMFIGFSNLLLRVEKIIWGEDIEKILVCCGVFLKVQEGPHEGSRILFPFGKIPEDFWNPQKYGGWTVQIADSQWDSILSPIFTVMEVDSGNQDFTGED